MSIEAGTCTYKIDEASQTVEITTQGKRIQGEQDPGEVLLRFHKDELSQLPRVSLSDIAKRSEEASESVSIDPISFLFFGMNIVLEKYTSFEGAWAGSDVDFSGPYLVQDDAVTA